jgi:hypothetical protein
LLPFHAAHLLGDGAGDVLRGWLREDVLIRDTLRSLYLIEQEVVAGGVTYVRQGFLAITRVTATPQANRWLPILRETHLHAQPALALFPGDESPTEVLRQAAGPRPPLEAELPWGGRARLWAVTDQHAASTVQGMMSGLPLDVVHGAEVLAALAAFRDERVSLGLASDPAPVFFALTCLMSETEPGPAVPPPVGLVYYSLRNQ